MAPLLGQGAAIVTAIISMAHDLGLEVIAEGVETLEQLEFLRGHNCDLAQGYYFSEPQPEAEILQWLSTRKSVPQTMIPAPVGSI